MDSARRVTRRRRRGQNEERQVDGQGVLVCVAVAAAPLIPLSSRRRRVGGGGGPTANEWARGGSQGRTHHFGRCLRLRGERKGELVVCVLRLQQRVSI
jgi:hypothetical protein